MSSTTSTDRISELLTKADEFIEAQDLAKAAQALKEAARLDGDNVKVKEKWATFKKLEDGIGDVLDLLRIYIGSQAAEDGEKVLQVIRSKALAEDQAIEAIDLVLNARSKPRLLDSIATTLLARNTSARKGTATKLAENATKTFERFFQLGDESFNAFAAVPLEALLWLSKEQQTTAQKDVFRLCVATLIEPGAENLERVMTGITRLVAMAPDTIAPEIDAEDVDAILSSLDVRLPASLRSQATLAISKVLEATKERGEEMFSTFINQRAKKQTNDDLVIVFSGAAAVFPLIPVCAAKLFLTDGFVQQLVPNLERNFEEGQAGNRKSHNLEKAALELLSAACLDNACREAINRYCAGWLENLAEEPTGAHCALAALVLAKISSNEAETATARLEKLLLSNDHEPDQAIEGLAYTSLQASVKEEIAKNDKLLQRLKAALVERQPVVFGCLTIISNLTAYRTNLSEEQKKMTQLKAYANSDKPAAESPLDDAAHVSERCRRVLDADMIPALIDCSRRSLYPTNIALATKILLSLAREQKHRTKMAQQGAVRFLLQIRERIAQSAKTVPDAAPVMKDASHALARLLISLNPEHTFSTSLPASNAVSALTPLLELDQNADHRDLLPTFEALLALTNLASMEDDSIRDLQVRLIWTQLEDQLLLSSNVLVQRAAVELVCNLVASPTCVAKFVGDGSKREATRMQILLALADAEDLATRRAAGGALAMITQWDAAVTSILTLDVGQGPKGVKTLLCMCQDNSDEMKHRGLVCVQNVVNAPEDVGKKGIERVKIDGGMEVVQEALKKTKDRAIMEVGVEVLKKLR